MTAHHPFRFGVVAATAGTGDEWADKARRVESLGFATLVTPDRVQHTLSPLPALAAAAAATRSLRVGTYVLANDFRNPVLLAKDAATLDVLSRGRFELGLGSGIPMPEDNQMLGIPFDSGRVRIDRLAESVSLVKRLWAGERATAPGPSYAAADAAITPPSRAAARAAHPDRCREPAIACTGGPEGRHRCHHDAADGPGDRRLREGRVAARGGRGALRAAGAQRKPDGGGRPGAQPAADANGRHGRGPGANGRVPSRRGDDRPDVRDAPPLAGVAGHLLRHGRGRVDGGIGTGRGAADRALTLLQIRFRRCSSDSGGSRGPLHAT